jgi:trehalose/maltose hydrolase-like predicted phosphorylase
MHKTEGMNAPPWYAEGNPWVLFNNEWQPERSVYFETIFTQSNGYMGVRGYREEDDHAAPSLREGYLAGMFAKLPPLARRLVIHDYPWDSRQMVALPEIFSASIVLDSESFTLSDGTIDDYEESLDMQNGVMERCVLWTSPSGKTSKLCFTRFLCAGMPNMAVQKIEIEPINWSGQAEIIWKYDIAQKTFFRCGDPAKPHVACPHCAVVETSCEDDRVRGVVETDGTRHRIAYASRVSGNGVQSAVNRSGLLSQSVARKVTAEKTSTWIRFTALATTRDAGVVDPLLKVNTLLDEADYESLVQEQQRIWAARWRDSDIEIKGSIRDQVLVRFGIYSLLQMAPFHADNLSIPARCYAYNRYNGLYFWDVEIFLLPFFQFCTPEVARNLLNFRCKTLPGAKKNAKLLGGKGAIFPWQGDADFGEEQAPWGLYEYLWHQNADIVYAFDQYARATGDAAFMLNEGLEVLSETARFWVSKLERDEDGVYHLDNTVGPDEAEDHGPDNGYTSLMARRSLEISHRWWTLALKKSDIPVEVGEDEVAEWKAIASKINVPEVPDCPGVPLQDAFFLNRKEEDISGMTVPEYWQRRGEVQVIKQADVVLAMYLLEDSFTGDEIERGYDFYEPKTLHVSSLSLNTHAIVAAIIGREEEAYDYFQRAAGLDLDNLRNATKDGLHAAALGTVWQMTIPGFMGMRVREDHIYFQPALPKAWDEIRFPIQYRGWRLQFAVRADGYRVEVSGNGQEGALMVIGSEQYALATGRTIEGGGNSKTDLKESSECSKSKQYSLT